MSRSSTRTSVFYALWTTYMTAGNFDHAMYSALNPWPEGRIWSFTAFGGKSMSHASNYPCYWWLGFDRVEAGGGITRVNGERLMGFWEMTPVNRVSTPRFFSSCQWSTRIAQAEKPSNVLSKLRKRESKHNKQNISQGGVFSILRGVLSKIVKPSSKEGQ